METNTWVMEDNKPNGQGTGTYANGHKYVNIRMANDMDKALTLMPMEKNT